MSDLGFETLRELLLVLRPAHELGELRDERLRLGLLERRERRRDVARRLKALIRLAREALLADGEEPGRQASRLAAQRLDVAVADREQHRELAAPGKHALADQHFAENRSEREKIGAMVEVFAGDLLRREIRELALEPAVRGSAFLLDARDAEVAELHLAAHRQVDVRGGHVAVHDAKRLAIFVGDRVDGGERFGDLSNDEERELERQGAIVGIEAAQQSVEVDALDVLHGEVRLALHLARAVTR